MAKQKIWSCKIGAVDESSLSDEIDDSLMRQAVRDAYVALTGRAPDFLFSDWDTTLTETERTVVASLSPNARVL